MLKDTILKAIATAKSALQDLAVPASIVVRAPNAFVPGQPASYTETLTSTAVVFTSYDEKEIDGTRIVASDIKGLIFAENTMPKPNDLIRADGIEYQVGPNSKYIMVGNKVALVELQLRIT